jgi:hypothetical protein
MGGLEVAASPGGVNTTTELVSFARNLNPAWLQADVLHPDAVEFREDEFDELLGDVDVRFRLEDVDCPDGFGRQAGDAGDFSDNVGGSHELGVPDIESDRHKSFFPPGARFALPARVVLAAWRAQAGGRFRSG